MANEEKNSTEKPTTTENAFMAIPLPVFVVVCRMACLNSSPFPNSDFKRQKKCMV